MGVGCGPELEERVGYGITVVLVVHNIGSEVHDIVFFAQCGLVGLYQGNLREGEEQKKSFMTSKAELRGLLGVFTTAIAIIYGQLLFQSSKITLLFVQFSLFFRIVSIKLLMLQFKLVV